MNEPDEVNGAPVPTYGNQRWWKVYRCRSTTPERVLILSEQLYGQWFHWIGSDNIPCTMREGCHWCAKNDPDRWNGYVAARIGAGGFECVYTITAHAARSLLPVIQERGGCRGLEVNFWRKPAQEGYRQRDTAKVLCALMKAHDPASIPPAFPVKFSIHRLYGVLSDRRQGVQQQPAPTIDPYKPPRFDYHSIPLVD